MNNAATRWLRAAQRRWLNQWLFQMKTAEGGEVFLRQRRVFIMPTRAGLGFGCALIVMFIGAVNYNLNLGFALTFLIASCALIDMHMTFRNLAHLYLSAARVAPVFAGEEAQFDLNLINRKTLARHAIWLGFYEPDKETGEQRAYPEQAADVPPMSTETVSLYVAAPARGWLRAPRVRLQTRFPLGLLRAWSYWSPDARALVYPQPETQAPPLPLGASDERDGAGQAGHDDFGGIRTYQPGDALRHLAWRQIARVDPGDGGQLMTKYFEGGAASRIALDFAALPAGLDLELKLSRLARWVLEAEQQGLAYSFTLGDIAYAPASGAAHRSACLSALAVYGLPPDAVRP